ncbi:MAG: hypothetical protein VB144_07610 [Clostridia bacterium]|nr:hypothetical protein [Clostridia bacterium]
MKKVLSLFAAVVLLLVMTTMLAGCNLGAPRLVVSFSPNPLRLEPETDINLTVNLRFDGIGFFNVKELRISYFDAFDVERTYEDLPSGKVLDSAIPAPGLGGLISVSKTLTDLNNGTPIKSTADWWTLLPHPAKMVFTFLDDSGNPVGGGDLRLEWY